MQGDFDKQVILKKTIRNVKLLESKQLQLRIVAYKSMNSFIKTMDIINFESKKIAFKHIYGAMIKQYMFQIPKFCAEINKLIKDCRDQK